MIPFGSNNEIQNIGTSLVVQWLKLSFPVQEVWVQSLLGELRSHMPCGQKTKTEQKQYGEKFNKDFKNGPRQKKKKHTKNFKKQNIPTRYIFPSQAQIYQSPPLNHLILFPPAVYLSLFPEKSILIIEHSKPRKKPENTLLLYPSYKYMGRCKKKK